MGIFFVLCLSLIYVYSTRISAKLLSAFVDIIRNTQGVHAAVFAGRFMVYIDPSERFSAQAWLDWFVPMAVASASAPPVQDAALP